MTTEKLKKITALGETHSKIKRRARKHPGQKTPAKRKRSKAKQPSKVPKRDRVKVKNEVEEVLEPLPPLNDAELRDFIQRPTETVTVQNEEPEMSQPPALERGGSAN